MSKRDIAMAFHSQGFNCAQSVFLAFCEDFGVSKDLAATLSLPFGGGMGQMRETCGALTGAFMVLGLANKQNEAPTPQEKALCYEKVRSLAESFQAENSSMLCRELLALAQENNEKKNCHELVGYTAELLEKFLKNN
ncbi:MAG: C_GCAxxG_C_C family protein [Ruminococcaceae bacterium]|nr:C_GCAxxG_C_C family protein [Oscillospiraceae bacterium]